MWGDIGRKRKEAEKLLSARKSREKTSFQLWLEEEEKNWNYEALHNNAGWYMAG